MGYPWQYAQDPLRQRLWTAKFLVGIALSKLLPWLFSPPIFLMIQEPGLSYTAILAKAQANTRRLAVLLGVLGVAVAVVVLRQAAGLTPA